MKAVLALVVAYLILHPLSIYAQEDGVHKEYFPNGAVQFERTYAGGQRHGPAKEYDEKGNLVREVGYVAGKKQGTLKDYYPDGTLKATFSMQDDVVHGLVQKFHASGKLAHEHNYENGMPDGKTQRVWEYYPDGALKYEYSYDAGMGYRNEYYQSGKVWKKYDINAARLFNYQEFDAEGNLTTEQKGGYNGALNTYDKNGKLIQINIYEDGRLVDFKSLDDSDPVRVMLTNRLLQVTSGKNSTTIYRFLQVDEDLPYIGFWKGDCSHDFGLAIDKGEQGFYSVTFCGPGGCLPEELSRPDTDLINDDRYRIIDADTIEMLEGDKAHRFYRCPAP